MALGRTRAVALSGLDGLLVDVEADVAAGLPAFTLTGLPDASLGEARDRMRAACTNSGVAIPPRRITVNLSPASVRKSGTAFDLAVTVVPDVVADPDAIDLSGGDLEGGSDDPGVLAAQLLDGWEDYLESLAEILGAGTYVGEIPAVADLDAVRDDGTGGHAPIMADGPERWLRVRQR